MKALSIVYLGTRQAGCIGLLTLQASGCRVRGVVAYDEQVRVVAEALGIRVLRSIRGADFEELIRDSDLLVCVHGREIVPAQLLSLPRYGGINVHPCLSSYPGAHPVERFVRDGNSRASVGVHRMTERVDQGEMLVEEFINVTGKCTAEEVYNVLYPWYAVALLKALERIRQEACQSSFV